MQLFIQLDQLLWLHRCKFHSQVNFLIITTAWLQPWYPLKTQQICFAVMRSILQWPILQWPIKKFQTVYWKVLLSLSLQLQIWHKITTKLVGSELRKALSDLLLTSNGRPHWKNKLVILTMEWLSWLQPIEETEVGGSRFTLVLETIIAQGNQRESYPDHLTTLNYPAC